MLLLRAHESMLATNAALLCEICCTAESCKGITQIKVLFKACFDAQATIDSCIVSDLGASGGDLQYDFKADWGAFFPGMAVASRV